ncbi:MAG: hypothetical protein ACPIOQ_23770, partial [Promethearchaeia archaeon]
MGHPVKSVLQPEEHRSKGSAAADCRENMLAARSWARKRSLSANRAWLPQASVSVMSVGMAALPIGLVMLCSGLGRVACFAPPRLPAAIRLGPTGHAAPSLHTRSERPRSAFSAFSRRGQAVVALAAGQRDGEKPRAVGMQGLLADPEMMRAMQVKCHMQLAVCRARAPSFARACFLMHPRRGTEPEGDAGDDGAANGGGHVEVRKRPRSHMVPREIEGPDAGRCSSRRLCRGDALRRPWP